MLSSRKLVFYRMIAGIMPEGWRFQWLRTRLLRWCGAEIGTGVYFSARTRFEGGGRLVIEDGAWIGPYTLLSASGATLRIGRNSWVAHMCSLKTKTHEVDPAGPSIAGHVKLADIIVGEGSWVCAMVTIIPGVTVGKKCICAAGAVVIRDVPSYSLVAGVPAVCKKKFDLI